MIELTVEVGIQGRDTRDFIPALRQRECFVDPAAAQALALVAQLPPPEAFRLTLKFLSVIELGFPEGVRPEDGGLLADIYSQAMSRHGGRPCPPDVAAEIVLQDCFPAQNIYEQVLQRHGWQHCPDGAGIDPRVEWLVPAMDPVYVPGEGRRLLIVERSGKAFSLRAANDESKFRWNGYYFFGFVIEAHRIEVGEEEKK